MEAEIICGLVGLIVAFTIVNTITRRVGRRKTERLIIASQQVVNAALRDSTPVLERLGVTPGQDITSNLVANIWGHNVMAFECGLKIGRRGTIAEFERELGAALSKYSAEHDLHAYGLQVEPLVVTDAWYSNSRDEVLFDVAYVINDQTVAYLRDLARLNQPKF